jgi:hypothetical protein
VNGAGGAAVYLLNTTVADGNSTTIFCLTAGSPNDLEYLNHSITVIDATDPNRASERRIINYTGANKQVAVDRELTFTPTAGDVARIVEGGYSTGSFGFGRLTGPEYQTFVAALRRQFDLFRPVVLPAANSPIRRRNTRYEILDMTDDHYE